MVHWLRERQSSQLGAIHRGCLLAPWHGPLPAYTACPWHRMLDLASLARIEVQADPSDPLPGEGLTKQRDH